MLGQTINKPVETQAQCDRYASMAEWCNNNNAHIEDKGEYYEIVENAPAPEPTIDEIKEQLIATVQAHLDNACKERGYDNGFACASYATFSVPKFKAEAHAVNDWVSLVWVECYKILDDVKAGKRPIPTKEELIAELPKLEW